MLCCCKLMTSLEIETLLEENRAFAQCLGYGGRKFFLSPRPISMDLFIY